MFLIAGCSADPTWSGAVPAPDRAMFDTAVYPLLLRDCAFTACHGGEHRFLQVFGPGRVRLEGAGSGPAREAQERQLSYERARSMLVAVGSGSILQAPLLTKPLEVAAGGASHEGVDNFGRNVFQTAADPRYQTLVAWAQTAQTALQPTAAATGAAGSGAPP